MSKTFLIQSDGLGRGDEKLGKVLMASFMGVLEDSPEKPAKVLFWNSGVRLVCEGSPVLEHLKGLEAQDVEILACSTCLNYLNLMDKIRVGSPTNMVKSVESLINSEVICL
jgi:selenium metabolism protein YedF